VKNTGWEPPAKRLGAASRLEGTRLLQVPRRGELRRGDVRQDDQNPYTD